MNVQHFYVNILYTHLCQLLITYLTKIHIQNIDGSAQILCSFFASKNILIMVYLLTQETIFDVIICK